MTGMKKEIKSKFKTTYCVKFNVYAAYLQKLLQ